MGKKVAPLVYPVGLWASILGIIQGFVWTIFAIIALLLYYKVYEYETNFDSYSHSLTATIYILYFNSQILTESGLETADIIATPDNLAIFSWIYLFLSFLWFTWSCWQLWVILHGKFKFARTAFVVWSVLTVFVTILDVVLISLLANDYNYYNTFVSDEGYTVSFYFILACGIVMSAAARGYLLLLINVIFVAALIKIIASGIEENTSDVQVDRRPINAFAPVRNPNEGWTSEQSGPQTTINNNNTDAWISNPTAVINEAFDFMGEQKPPPFNRTQSLSTIPNGTSYQNGHAKTSSPAGSYKVATVGRKGISATSLAPFIPEPDYTPPASPTSKKKPVLKSVLKNRSQYN